MIQTLKIIPTALLEVYKKNFYETIQQHFENLQESELSTGTFSFYTSVSVVFSSKIEGEEIELDSFIKHKRLGVHYQPDYTRKIDDLYSAYEFAADNKLTPENLLKAHALLTKNILHQSQQGQLRKGNMFVITEDGKIEYVAATPDKVKPEMQKLYNDIKVLLEADLDFVEVLFFASMLHLVFVKIHPFEDGNGRSGRLLEKWFIAQKLGTKAWFIQSEKYYYNQHQEYYINIRKLGLEYDELDYDQSLPFLEMLPKSVGN
jgi:Fic family protein